MDARGRMRPAARRLAKPALACAAVLLAALAVRRVIPEGHTTPERVPEPPRAVSVVAARTRALPVELQASGFVVSEHVVQVRPQVAGLLKRIFFTEGEAVRAGQRLFLIDPAPFAADLDSARAVRDSARANLRRMQGLVQGNYVTPQDYINARSGAEQAEAAYRRAEINLSYTDIRASVSGRSGALATRTGNLVAPADGAALVTIVQTRPIEVQFALAQRYLPRLRAAQTALEVAVLREDGGGELDRGDVVFVDNAVNAGTGTVTLKARLPNEREQLWPGQLVTLRVRLALEPRALVVPESALLTGAAGNYVYVLEGGRATPRDVTVNRHAGELAVIAGGLREGEQLIERVPSDLRPGTPVTPAAPEPPPRAPVRLPEPGA